MVNMIQKAKDQVLALTEGAYRTAAEAGRLPAGVAVRCGVEIPKDPANGDYTTTFALAAAKAMKKNPREIAGILMENMHLEGSYFTSVEIAGAGFLNFRLGGGWYAGVLAAIDGEGPAYGRSDALRGQKIMVEFVSANPTGPMHMGNARGGVLGDCLSEVLSWAGHDVTREFYINDAGNQVDKFAHSVEGRYIQALEGEDAVTFDESWYQGADIRELACEIIKHRGDALLSLPPEERRQQIVEYGLPANIEKMERDLARYKIHYDVWFRESGLHDSGYVEDTVALLEKAGVTYEQDGALWLRSTDFGCDKDDVLRRANGFYTYFAADIAYHRNKFEVRGFDRVINIWGADHHGHVARLQRALDAIGLDGSHRLEIVLMQLVRMMQGGEIVRMSKRTGKSLTLSDLLDEIPVDAARFFFNSRAAETQMEFDLDLAVKQDSENPLYYVQYAHARICSVLRTVEPSGEGTPDLTLLVHEDEKQLIKAIALLPDEILLAARDRDPSKLNKFGVLLAGRYHKFYDSCRIKDAEPALRDARLALCRAARQVVSNVLSIIGADAPERM